MTTTNNPKVIELIPNYQSMFRTMIHDAKIQSNVGHMMQQILPKGDRAELLRELQRWFAPLTIAANCATTLEAVNELRSTMAEILAAIDQEAARQERADHGQDEDPTDGKGLL